MAVAISVAIAVAAGGGWALAASSTGVIKACAKKKGGALRIANHCKKGKEKAISWNAQGQAGSPGSPGTPGTPGAVGPTFGTVSTGDDPPALTGSSVVDTTLTTNLPHAGSVWVSAHFEPVLTCGGTCSVTYGSYVDGTPVHGGRRIFSGTTPVTPVESWGISVPLSAGAHTITLEYTPSGSFTSATEGVTVELGGILLGTS